jgi:hypothetical protein
MPSAILAERGRVIWGLSLHGWEEVMRFSLALAGVFALIVGVSTYFVVTLQREEIAASRDEFERYKLDAGAKISAANAEAASASQNAAQAQLALEKLKAPRLLSANAVATLSTQMRSFPRTPVAYGVFQDPESIALLEQLSGALLSAGWIEQAWNSGGDVLLTRGSRPGVGFTYVTGVYVQADQSHVTDFGPIITALAKLLTDAGIDAKPEVGRMAPNTNNDAIKILIGQKPR